jgi:putative PIN family toxin of toxin-antitoxin system
MIRVVIDANVFVSAVLTTRGNAAQILDAWRTKQFELVVSSVILEELARVLQYPRIAKRHGLSEERIQEFLDELAHLALQTPGELTLDVIKGDPSDNRYLECAVEGAADVIVSGDQDLLDLEGYQGIHILTPRAFLTLLRESARQP